MSRLFFTKGQGCERRTGFAGSPRIVERPGRLPSAAYGSRWRSLPVEGSKAWRERQPILSRIFSR